MGRPPWDPAHARFSGMMGPGEPSRLGRATETGALRLVGCSLPSPQCDWLILLPPALPASLRRGDRSCCVAHSRRSPPSSCSRVAGRPEVDDITGTGSLRPRAIAGTALRPRVWIAGDQIYPGAVDALHDGLDQNCDGRRLRRGWGWFRPGRLHRDGDVRSWEYLDHPAEPDCWDADMIPPPPNSPWW